jgi:hypothetical protein
MQRLTAAPYALNSGLLEGLNSDQFVQLAQGVQTDASTADSIAINKTGASGAILHLQKAGVDALTVNNSGSLVLGQAGSSGANGTLVFSTTNASNSTITLAAASTASSYYLTLPTTGPSTGQCLQTDASDNTQLVFGACGATGSFLSKDTTDTSTADAGSGYLYSFTNSGSSGTGGVLSLDNGSNTGTVLNVKGTGTSAFKVQNGSSQQVLGVDTSANQAVLGQSTAVDGSLLFKNSTTSHGITINSTNANSSYTLTLPAAAPAGGLCIETSPGDATQLVFASCSNNNASIQEVNNWDSNNSNTVSVSPSTAGDEMVLTTQIPTGGVTVTNVSGGGVTNWTQVVTSPGNGTVNRVEMWVGTVITTGSSNITVTYSSSPGANEIAATEFTAAGVNASTSWGIQSSGALLNSSASATVTYPNLTAVNGSELYVGYAQVQNPPAIGNGSTGFSYLQTSTQHNMTTYNPSLTANTAYQPTALQNSSGQSNTVAAILTAFVTSSSINNTTSLQKANFYVQAASGGSVAGVLQAASSGTADILQLRNSGSANVLAVSSAGNLTLQPADSASAMRVLNSNSYSVFSVDTSGNAAVLGQSSSLSGKLTFKSSGGSNSVSIAAPSSIAASYTLTLPTDTPTAGLCLGTSPSNANQLIFASCATEVSAATITYVNQWSNNGTSITTLSDSPASIGNLLTLYSHSTNNVSITGVSGGGVTNWSKVTSNVGGAGQGNNEMWRGQVTTTGSGTITVTYSSAAGANEIVAQEFTIGSSGGTWAIDTSGTLAGSSATINYPSLTPSHSSELYAGYAWSQNTMSSGSTPGFTYTATSGGKRTVYNTSVNGGTAYQPQATQSSGNFNSVAAVIAAYAGTSVIVNSTATQQANFNVQASLSGTVAGTLQGASGDSTDIFRVKNGSGNNVVAVSPTGTTLGTSNALAGSLTFASSGNSNTITIQAPTTPGASYSLTLPSAQAAVGQCLAASATDASQLVFSSCANQVTSVAISYVNSWKTSTGSNPATLAVSPANIGDLMVLFVSFEKANSVSGAGVSGGGCSVWSKVSSTGSGSGTNTTSIEMYRCQTTSTGSSNISVNWSGPAGTQELAAMEFTTGSTTGSWVVDASNTQSNSSSTTMTWPNLTPQSSRDLYVGYGATGSNYSSGSSAGFTYLSGSLSNRVGLYNTNISAATQPTASSTGSGASLTVGALVAAYSSSSVLSNSSVTQQANFNIQAATNNSVAGVLQAFPGSSYDIFQIMDDAGTVVDSFGSTGNLLLKPSTASASAFRVQTTGSANVLSVDTTSSKLVVVGAGATGEATPALLVLDSQTGSSSDPTAVTGAMYYNATTREFRCGVAGVWQNCSGLLYSNTSKSSTNSSCSNNCAAFSTAAPIPADYCQAGRVIKLSAEGVFSSQASATNLQFGIYYGTDGSVAANDVLLGALSPAVSVTSASNNYFDMDFNVTCFSPTSMQSGGVLNLQVGAAASGLTPLPVNSATAATVVSSSTKNLYIFPVWSAASASNTAQITQFHVVSP